MDRSKRLTLSVRETADLLGVSRAFASRETTPRTTSAAPRAQVDLPELQP